MLAWADANLPKDDPVVKRQLASLRGRVNAVDFDVSGDTKSEIAESTEPPGSTVTQPVQAAKQDGVMELGNLRIRLKADRSSTTPAPKPPRAKSNPELDHLRAAAKKARQEAYGFPAHSAIVRGAERLEAQVAEMEAEIWPP